MTEKEIQEVLEKLGEKVSILAEENRVFRTKHDAGKQLISDLSQVIDRDSWVKVYEGTADPFVKDLMLEWGPHLFPKGYKDEN